MTEPVSRLAASGSSYAAAVGLQVLVQAASLPLLTRLLSPAEYGLTATALVIGNLLAVLVDLGLARAVTRAHYRGETGPSDATGLVLGALAVVVALTGVMLLLLPLWGGWLGRDARTALQAAVLLGGAMASRNVLLGLLRAAERTRAYVAVMLLGTAGAQVLGLAAAAVRPTPAAYLLGLASGSLAGAGLGLLVSRPRLGAVRDSGLRRWALRFALPLVPAELAGVAIWFSDRLVIERFLGLDDVGRYQIAYTLGSVLLMLAMGVSQAWAPVVYGATADHRGAIADESRALLLRLASYGVAVVALAAPVLLVLAIPAEYEPDGLFWVTSLVALSVLPLITQQAATHLLSDADRTGWLGAVGMGAAALNVVVNLLLVPLWGLTGSALATLLTYVAYAGAVAAAARRSTGLRFGRQPLPWVVAGVAVVVGSALPASGLWSVARTAGALLAVGWVLREVLRLVAARRLPSAAAS